LKVLKTQESQFNSIDETSDIQIFTPAAKSTQAIVTQKLDENSPRTKITRN